MNSFFFGLTLTAALGSGLIAGIFFAFSTFIMRALGEMTPAAGIEAMQRINVTVLNPWFLGVFMGTAIAGGALAVSVFWRWNSPEAAYLLAGGVLYVVGTFAVTAMFNVPMNDALAAMTAASDEAAKYWTTYLDRWTFWNHVRTVAALLATAAFALALR